MNKNATDGISTHEAEIMTRLLRMQPEPQKAASKPATAKGAAQRRRREKERQTPTAPTYGD